MMRCKLAKEIDDAFFVTAALNWLALGAQSSNCVPIGFYTPQNREKSRRHFVWGLARLRPAVSDLKYWLA